MKNDELSKLRLENFGFVYQFHHLLEDMTILENVLLPNQYNKSDKKFNNEEIFNLLEKVGLSEDFIIYRGNYQVEKTKSSNCKSYC